jgi:hypothetical protein
MNLKYHYFPKFPMTLKILMSLKIHYFLRFR